MLYDKEILTIYEAKNGFVVKCYKPKPEVKPAKDGSTVYVPETERYDVFVEPDMKSALAVIEAKLKGRSPADEEYAAGFKEATAKGKRK